MKKLINKNNPAIRITAPEITETSLYYVLDFANDDNTSVTALFKDDWTLVEEEPTEGIRGKKEEIPSNVDLVEEITDKSRACCNCVNGVLQYPKCFCWQHKYCNTDKPYTIPKENWLETAKTCKEFEFEPDLNARKV